MNGLFKHVKENQFILLENDGNDNLISRKEEDMALQVIRIKLIPQASKIWNTRHTRMPLITNTEINKNLIMVMMKIRILDLLLINLDFLEII